MFCLHKSALSDCMIIGFVIFMFDEMYRLCNFGLKFL